MRYLARYLAAEMIPAIQDLPDTPHITAMAGPGWELTGMEIEVALQLSDCTDLRPDGSPCMKCGPEAIAKAQFRKLVLRMGAPEAEADAIAAEMYRVGMTGQVQP